MQQYQELALELHQQLCPIPAPSHFEDQRAAFCLEKLREFGYENAYIDEAKNVICFLPAENSTKTMMFAAHTDVVFPDREMLPFRQEAGKVYCPGCGDDTACVAQLLSVMKMIKDCGKTPACNVVFVLDACEEGLGNLKGIRAAIEQHHNELAAFVTFDGKYHSVVDRSVGSHRYRVTVRTKGGHSYGDFGNENAARVLAEGIRKIYEISIPQGGKTTCNVGMISGGTSVNTIMQEASMLCEYRSDMAENLQYMQAEFQKIFAYMAELAQVDVELVGDRPGGKNVDPAAQKALTDICAQIQEKHTGTVPCRCSGSTDCNIPHSMGIPAVCVGTYMGGGAHTRQEWVDAESIRVGVGIVADVVQIAFR